MPRPLRPTDLYVANGWYMELPGLVSPHFETLEGLQKTQNSVELVDAGTNRKHKFSTQIQDFGEMTLTRTFQGTADDKILYEMIMAMMSRGLTVPARAVKMHNGKEVFSVIFEDFRFTGINMPTFDVNSEEKFTASMPAACSNWEIL